MRVNSIIHLFSILVSWTLLKSVIGREKNVYCGQIYLHYEKILQF